MPGFDLCPDPAAALTPADLTGALRRYRVWAGEPSYRVMAARTRHVCAASTLHAALNSQQLPPLATVQAIVTACGGTPEHYQAFTTAWRRIRLASPTSAALAH